MGQSAQQTIQTFWREWRGFHGSVAPIAHQLRAAPEVHWIRFHALPLSKRYAESSAERAEILRRADVLGEEVLGTNVACWLVECQPSLRPPMHGFTLNLPEPDGEFSWVGQVRQSRWDSGRFSALLESIADDRMGPTLWMNRENGAVFAPYDGGFDLFPGSEYNVSRLKEGHRAWLSGRPDGL